MGGATPAGDRAPGGRHAGAGAPRARRLFAAVWPSPALVGKLRSLERPRPPGVRWTAEGQWHVTLRFFGNLDAAAEEDVRGRLAEVAHAARPFDVSAGPRTRVLGRAVLALPVAGLDDIARAVREATAGVGRPPGTRPFAGHLTLARSRHPRVLAALPPLQVAAGWSVRELTLVSSDLLSGGASYEVVGSWPLGSVEPPQQPEPLR